MNGSFLLDTNIIIAIFAEEPQVQDALDQASRVFIPSIAIGELCFGAKKSRKVEENLLRLKRFIAGNEILECDVETAFLYGEIKNVLRLKGNPIPDNDSWIAAIAIQHDLILVTRDAHFRAVENLQCVAW